MLLQPKAASGASHTGDKAPEGGRGPLRSEFAKELRPRQLLDIVPGELERAPAADRLPGMVGEGVKR